MERRIERLENFAGNGYSRGGIYVSDPDEIAPDGSRLYADGPDRLTAEEITWRHGPGVMLMDVVIDGEVHRQSK